MTAVPLESSNTRLLEFGGDLGDGLSVAVITVQDETKSGVVCGFIHAVPPDPSLANEELAELLLSTRTCCFFFFLVQF